MLRHGAGLCITNTAWRSWGIELRPSGTSADLKTDVEYNNKKSNRISSGLNKSPIELQKVHCYSIRPTFTKPHVSRSLFFSLVL
jgi:hypothetical protein